MLPSELEAVAVVTPEQGETFASEWLEFSLGVLEIVEVFEEAGIMKWPDDPEAQGHYQDIADEILPSRRRSRRLLMRS